ncbi:hypothetical protein SUDANB120_05676 [Streptomyces sp. enrichment culture]|uniref:hypothetical protein n=1 Tax=Streptomyces TaxID=1883 RepID=UPI00167266E8|nr:MULTISPECIES: hypothetical protein [Streptomyces]MBD3575730.1 hypothetical protein [Streptomyces sp. KD18]GGT25618.1 hypothetical protein GCM10010286_58790 [Streptomyces toxytricini]
MDVDAVMRELYALHPGGFVAARNAYAARAKREGDPESARTLSALRRPTLAVWAANLLAGAEPERVAQLLESGDALRRAHRELDGRRIRELSAERNRLSAGLARDAAALAERAGERGGEALAREVEAVLHGLAGDEESGRDWAEGHLAQAPAPRLGFEGLEPGPAALSALNRPTPAATEREPAEPAPPAAHRERTKAEPPHKRPGEPARERTEESAAEEKTPKPTGKPAGRAAARATEPPPPKPAGKTAVRKPARAPEPPRDAVAERQAARQEARVEAALRAVAAAEEERERARTVLDGAAKELDRTSAAAEALREELSRLRIRLEAAEEAAGAARSRHRRAEQALRKAERTADAATRRLGAARSHGR